MLYDYLSIDNDDIFNWIKLCIKYKNPYEIDNCKKQFYYTFAKITTACMANKVIKTISSYHMYYYY